MIKPLTEYGLSAFACELLILIEENSQVGQSGVSWSPGGGKHGQYCALLRRFVHFTPKSHGRAWKMLRDRGLIEPHATAHDGEAVAYAAHVTEAGDRLVASWITSDRWPVARGDGDE